MSTSASPRLAVSNIAWPASLDEEAFSLLRGLGISAVEIAPTRIWPDWNDATLDNAGELRDRLSRRGFTIPSMQAILFGKPDCKLFGTSSEREALKEHLDRCAALAVALGATSLVFGAPKNRDRGSLTPDQAFDSAAAFFRGASPSFAERGVYLCLEANPPQYACNFASDSHVAASLVRAVDSPGFRLHLDTACMTLAGEDLTASITAHADLLQHFHASEPDLGSFERPTIDHLGVNGHLRNIGYRGWVSLEMRPAAEPLEGLRTGVMALQSNYGCGS